MHFRSINENKIRLSSISQSVYAKADDISIETNRRGARPYSLFVQTNALGVLNAIRHSSHCAGSGFAAECGVLFWYVLTYLSILGGRER